MRLRKQNVSYFLFVITIMWVGCDHFRVDTIIQSVCASSFIEAFIYTPCTYLCRNNAKKRNKSLFESKVSFSSPLLEAGYPPTVSQHEDGILQKMPLLIYLPGFDGTLIAPFLQFPELSTVFDVRGMNIGIEDRSNLKTLTNLVLKFIEEVLLEDNEVIDNSWQWGKKDTLKDQNSFGGKQTRETLNKQENKQKGKLFPAEALQQTEKLNNILSKIFRNSALPVRKKGKKNRKKMARPVYIMGESFGGILALEICLALTSRTNQNDINLQGLVLINPATCYDRSKLAADGPKVAALPGLLYPFGLLRLIPLFTDKYAIPQLLLILQSKALPSVVNNPEREAYMGRTAFSLPSKLKFMPQDTLKWRLEEWLQKGCKAISSKDDQLKKNLSSLPVLVVAGECDKALPSIAEAERLLGIFDNVQVHVVEGAGHANTAGSRVDLTAIMRKRFLKLVPISSSKRRRKVGTLVKQQKSTAMQVTLEREGVNFGMEPRYDDAAVGLSPLLYWSNHFYKKFSEK